MIVVQIGAGGTSQECFYNFPDLQDILYLAVVCIIRVYALYGRSRRILGFLLLLAAGAIFSTMVGRFSL